ncbi:MAG: hypothetical protein EA344_04595 [Alkalicoccus sp.]|nr:MAG: hypothetical protein EA344_04595 [Alkalicoccus sp.]
MFPPDFGGETVRQDGFSNGLFLRVSPLSLHSAGYFHFYGAFFIASMSLLKLHFDRRVPAAIFTSRGESFRLSLPSGRIFQLSFSAGVLKNRLGTRFFTEQFVPGNRRLSTVMDRKMKRKPADANGRKWSDDPAGRQCHPEISSTAGWERSFLKPTTPNRALFKKFSLSVQKITLPEQFCYNEEMKSYAEL